jgi:Fur family zinc uptake transcriptional regulator
MMPTGQRQLTRNQNAVLLCLRGADQPLSAYQVLDLLRDDGITAPTTVYRALGRLVTLGLAHKLSTINAFTACAHGRHSGEAVFVVCDRCGRTVELGIRKSLDHLRAEAEGQGFSVHEMTIELLGRCADCRSESARPPAN